MSRLLGVDEGTVRTVLSSWGPGKFDAELFLDGKAFRPDGKSAATLIPAAFGLRGVNLHTWTGWGSLTQWNAFVANLEMHGKGNYTDARLDDASRFPVAARARHKARGGELPLARPRPIDRVMLHGRLSQGAASEWLTRSPDCRKSGAQSPAQVRAARKSSWPRHLGSSIHALPRRKP